MMWLIVATCILSARRRRQVLDAGMKESLEDKRDVRQSKGKWHPRLSNGRGNIIPLQQQRKPLPARPSVRPCVRPSCQSRRTSRRSGRTSVALDWRLRKSQVLLHKRTPRWLFQADMAQRQILLPPSSNWGQVPSHGGCVAFGDGIKQTGNPRRKDGDVIPPQLNLLD